MLASVVSVVLRARPVAFALAFLAIAGCGDGPPASEAPAPAAEAVPLAPDFTLKTPEGEPFTLSEHRGEVVVLNFWATWCAPCVAEIPELMAMQDALAGQDVRFVGVSQDTGPRAFEDVRDFRAILGVTYPLLLDPGLAVGRAYDGAAVLPTTVVVDRAGRVHARAEGLLTEARLRDLLRGVVTLPGGAPTGLDVPTYEPSANRPEGFGG